MDNYKKLVWVIRYMGGDPEKYLTLEADKIYVVKW